MKKRILVVGATSRLGQPIVYQLSRDNFLVRIFSRNEDKAKEIFGSSYEIICGKISENNILKKAVEDCFGIYLNLPPQNGFNVAKSFIDVCAGKNLDRIACITGSTVEERNTWFPHIEEKYRIEQLIQKSGIPYTIFKPSWFMESLPKFVMNGRATIFGKQPNPFHWLAAADYAKLVSNAFKTDAAKNKKFYIHGPEEIRMHDALQKYVQKFHPDIKVSTMPYWLIKIIALLSRKSELKMIVSLMEYFEKVPEKGDPTEANEILGSLKITLDEWIRNRE
ncbi:NAD(P)H-binding protein [candidate division KSB1 bacterium]|nr:NAD(P)H-binding protein [candidate division KSB1 bacterium]